MNWRVTNHEGPWPPKNHPVFIVEVQEDDEGWYALSTLPDGPHVFRLPAGYSPEDDGAETVMNMIASLLDDMEF